MTTLSLSSTSTRKFSAVDGQFARLKIEFNNLQTSADAHAKKADTYFQEMLMLSRKVERLEWWVLELADKLNVDLKA